MSTALCIPFYRYHPHVGDYYKVYFDMLIKTLPTFRDEFDALYLIDQEWHFSQPEEQQLNILKKNSRILHSPVTGHHWEQFKWAIPQIQEDTILFMDNDVYVYKSGVIASWFEKAEKADIVAAFDGSGGLKEQVHKRYPIMEDLGTRMGSYYFILKKNLLDRLPHYDFAPITYTEGTFLPELNYHTVKGDWSDSFGLFTIRALALNPKIDTIIDDRSSIYFDEEITMSPAPKGLDLGYYHLRNGNLPVLTLIGKHNKQYQNDYNRIIKETPKRELLRLLMWFRILTGDKYIQETLPILFDLGVSVADWENYLTEFKKYHGI